MKTLQDPGPMPLRAQALAGKILPALLVNFLFCLPLFTVAQNSCTNIDFESRSTSGWIIKGDHELVSSGIDSFGKFPKVFPGAGKYSLRLNNNNIGENKTSFLASASRLIHVTPQSNFMNLHFAMVILNFPHDSSEAARFCIRLRDATTGALLCPRFNCYYEEERGAVGAGNFSTSPVLGLNTGNQTFEVTCAAWQTVGIDLSAYNGRNIQIEITCDWCIYSVDWAYCYLDADCKSAPVKTNICAPIPHKFTGPPGFTNYRWYGPNSKTLLSSSDSVIAKTPGTYTLQCNQSDGCFELPFTFVYQVSPGPDPAFQVKLHPCALTADFNVLSKDINNNYEYTWKWTDSLAKGPTNIKRNFASPGKKTVELTVRDMYGCTSYSKATFTLNQAPEIFVTQNDGAKTLFSAFDNKHYTVQSTRVQKVKLNYVWTGPDFYVNGSSVGISHPGTYTVVGTDPSNGCTDTVVTKVYFDDIIPNIFTPNSDGVNDAFSFRTSMNAEFRVLDRWGNLVHQSVEHEGIISWDGLNKNGKPCSDGVFMYTLRPLELNPGQRSLAGTVTLVR